jgi:hypothetical protein
MPGQRCLQFTRARPPGAVALMIAGSMDGPHALALGERLLDLFADAGLSPPTARAGHLLIAFYSNRSPWRSPTWAKSSRPNTCVPRNSGILEAGCGYRCRSGACMPPAKPKPPRETRLTWGCCSGVRFTPCYLEKLSVWCAGIAAQTASVPAVRTTGFAAPWLGMSAQLRARVEAVGRLTEPITRETPRLPRPEPFRRSSAGFVLYAARITRNAGNGIRTYRYPRLSPPCAPPPAGRTPALTPVTGARRLYVLRAARTAEAP